MKIALLGDIAFIGSYDITCNSQLQERLRGVSDYLNDFDYVIGNLETPFSRLLKPNGAKSAYIYANPRNVEILKLLHVDAVCLANNHMFDFGNEGYKTTTETLSRNGIEYFGVDGRSYSIKECDNSVIFNGFCCYSSSPLEISKYYGAKGVNRFNVEEVSKILETNKHNGCLSILSVHAGIEHVNYPSIDQIKFTRQFGDIANYIYYGHHPHVIQGIECYKNSIIAHSLGNFCFDGCLGNQFRSEATLSKDNRRGMILELTIEHNRAIDYATTFIRIGEDGTISLYKSDNEFTIYSECIKDALKNVYSYEAMRKEQRNVYVSERKSQRNLRWIIKRLRPRYFKLFVSGFFNREQYIKNVKSLLK
jgi:poly-gamma-glutamate synthesis protein (capsule biosynthesis protein)